MAALTTLLIGSHIASTALQVKQQLTADAAPRGRGRPGIPDWLRDAMLQRLEELKRERRPNEARGRRAKEVGRGYGDVVNDTDALICLMRDLYRERLIGEGNAPVEADRIVAEYAQTDEFQRHLNTHKVELSRERKARRKVRR